MKKAFSLNYIKGLVNWLESGTFYILSLIVVILTSLYITKILDFMPDIVSLAFSITGLFILLIQQITDARQFSTHNPNTFHNWIKSFPTLKPITIQLNSAVFSLSTSKANMTVSISENESIEKKVEFLIKEVRNIQKVLDNVDDRIENVAAILEKKSKEFSSNIEKLDNSLNSVIASHIVGDYDKNYFAIIITLCGSLIQFFTQ